MDGGTVVRPMFWEFDDDEIGYKMTELMMMIGKWILVSPVLFENIQEVHPYLPNANWYDFNNFK